jgi:hypothetical protein
MNTQARASHIQSVELHMKPATAPLRRAHTGIHHDGNTHQTVLIGASQEELILDAFERFQASTGIEERVFTRIRLTVVSNSPPALAVQPGGWPAPPPANAALRTVRASIRNNRTFVQMTIRCHYQIEALKELLTRFRQGYAWEETANTFVDLETMRD